MSLNLDYWLDADDFKRQLIELSFGFLSEWVVVLNRTGHRVKFSNSGREVTFPSEKKTVRVNYTRREKFSIGKIPISIEEYKDIDGIPTRKEKCLYIEETKEIWNPSLEPRVFYIVSRVAYDACDRPDVLCAGALNKDAYKVVQSASGLTMKESTIEWVKTWPKNEAKIKNFCDMPFPSKEMAVA